MNKADKKLEEDLKTINTPKEILDVLMGRAIVFGNEIVSLN